MSTKIEKITIVDFSELNMRLKSAGLPLIVPDQFEHFFKVCDHPGKIAAAIGLEIYGTYGLLRSLVVKEACRNKGIAFRLVQNLIVHAKKLGLKKIYLLTTTADKYFEKHSFERISRDNVPEEIKQSREFSLICPASAIVMELTI